MTREEKQKAIDALKISAPVMAMTQEEFNDYIQTLNKVMDWLEQEPKEITLEDVKGYCKPRLLTIITNELYHELTHFKIKALEQEPILDQIRAEIAEIPKKYPMTMDYENGLKEALTIIDKYKAESEDKE